MFLSFDGPLQSLPIGSQVSSANLRLFPEFVQQLGGMPEQLLERHDINPASVGDSDSFISSQAFVQLFEDCSSALNDPLFGLHMAEQQDAEIYGLVTTLCRAAPDFNTALQGFIEYLPIVHSPESLLELDVGKSVTELRWSEHNDMGDNAQASYQGLLLMLKIFSSLTSRKFTPLYINLPREVFGSSAYLLARSTGCRVRLSYGKACIAFPSSLLGERLRTANRALYHLLKGYLASLQVVDSDNFEERVISYLRAGFSNGRVAIDDCAEKMGISARTLQTRLKVQGSSYSDLLEQERRKQAEAALKRTDLSIADLADSLGYSERTSFGRAFKRWTGVSPQQYRKAYTE